MVKIPIWSHLNVSRENYFASSRDEKSNMIQKFYSDIMKQGKSIFYFLFFRVKILIIGQAVIHTQMFLRMAFFFINFNHMLFVYV